MATYTKRGEKYLVRWKELHVTRAADGGEIREWKDRGRSVPTERDAKQLVAEVERLQAFGQRWEDQREVAVVSLGAVADAYNAAAADAPEATRKWRRSLMRAWVDWAGADTRASALTLSFLEAYAASLPSRGRGAATRHRRLLEVERMWRWARRRPDLFPGVPEPMVVTGKDAGAVKAPPPVVRLAAPGWDDVDRMIRALRTGWRYGDVHRRIALLLRYTGLRIGQAQSLYWDDVELNHPTPFLRVRAGRVGAKSSAGRVIPLHPALVSEMAGWGVRSGKVFDPGPQVGATWQDGEATRTAFRTAWQSAGVDRAKWDVTDGERERGERAHGSPCHAIRACVKVGLLRAGVSDSLADYFIGHHRGATSAAYVPEAAPETSPYWSALVAAVETIPPFEPTAGVVVALRA